jgi:hypothetical protein
MRFFLRVEMTRQKIKTGYLYHIKDEYFDIVDNDTLMKNHERNLFYC